MPANAPGQLTPEWKVPMLDVVIPTPPTVVVPTLPKIEPPSVPQIEPQPVQPEVSKGDFNEEYVKEHGQAVEVVTDPAGAKIELNGEPLGVTPGTFYMIRKPNQYGFLPRMTIKAIPPEGAEGLYEQTKIFDGYTDTPEKIYFDMSLPPPLPRLEDGY